MEKLGPQWADFHEFFYVIFPKSVHKIPVSLKGDKNKGHIKLGQI
jgi:hypothetical protein